MKPDPEVRLLFVGNFPPPAKGSRNISEELLQRLEVNGWQVLKTSSLESRPLKLMDMVGTALFRSSRYDLAIIDTFSGPAFFWAEAVCAVLRFLRKPLIMTLHGGGLPAFFRRRPRRVRRLLGAAAAVASPSKWIIESFSSIRPDIRYIPNAIEISDYPFRLRSHPEPKLCWLRAFHAIYQPWLAVEVLAMLKPDFPHAGLTMIGPDKRDGSLERTQDLIRQNRLEGSVKIVGGVPKMQVPSRLAQGEVFLNTTRAESFGVSVLEAAACGLPIVTTNAGELPYLWKDGENALLAPPDNPSVMAGAVRRILTEPGLAGKLSLNARTRAEAFDWSNVLDSWEELLAQVSAMA